MALTPMDDINLLAMALGPCHAPQAANQKKQGEMGKVLKFLSFPLWLLGLIFFCIAPSALLKLLETPPRSLLLEGLEALIVAFKAQRFNERF